MDRQNRATWIHVSLNPRDRSAWERYVMQHLQKRTLNSTSNTSTMLKLQIKRVQKNRKKKGKIIKFEPGTNEVWLGQIHNIHERWQLVLSTKNAKTTKNQQLRKSQMLWKHRLIMFDHCFNSTQFFYSILLLILQDASRCFQLHRIPHFATFRPWTLRRRCISSSFCLEPHPRTQDVVLTNGKNVRAEFQAWDSSSDSGQRSTCWSLIARL